MSRIVSVFAFDQKLEPKRKPDKKFLCIENELVYARVKTILLLFLSFLDSLKNFLPSSEFSDLNIQMETHEKSLLLSVTPPITLLCNSGFCVIQCVFTHFIFQNMRHFLGLTIILSQQIDNTSSQSFLHKVVMATGHFSKCQ